MLMSSSRWWGRLCSSLTIVDSSNASCLHRPHVLFSFSYMILQECFFYFWHRSSSFSLFLSIDPWAFSLRRLLTCKIILFWRALQLLFDVVYLVIFLYEVKIVSPSVYLQFVSSKLCLCPCFLASLKYGISCLCNFHLLILWSYIFILVPAKFLVACGTYDFFVDYINEMKVGFPPLFFPEFLNTVYANP
jgi:hypothetical protein